ncbi:hypothetical protein KI688_010357 [Linnemannia hyalina]|uniref:SRPBCC domain-containing protein n=1 Tax=Linnemannia hyalina TaxID=64524 RepID=A0A9P7XY70_9FUNG|nr:hypothetical protein KI688_010357 [Linnemannia hyalina]
MKENKVSISIQASPTDVWSVLTDFDNYHYWNPMFTSVKGKLAEGESLSIKVRLPRRVFCGAPLSSTWSPRIIKLEPNSCLEWFTPAGLKGFVDGTHYFQLASTHNGTATEFTQGERYTGWGIGLYSSFGNMEDARRGFAAMNSALQIEILRRRQAGSLAEKTGSGAEGDDKGTREASDNEIAQLDISDPAAVAAIAVASTTANIAANRNQEESVSEKEARTSDVSASGAPSAAFSEGVQEPAAPAAPAPEKPVEKRTSIIGAVSSLFTSSKSPSASADRLPQSTSKDDLISKAVAEECEEHLNYQDNNYEDGDDHDGDEDGNDGGDNVHEVEDPETKRARETKNAERIELDLGSGDLSLGDFGF